MVIQNCFQGHHKNDTRLVYGLEAVVPMEFMVPSLRVSAEKLPKLPSNISIKHKSKYLMQLEEDRVISAYIA